MARDYYLAMPLVVFALLVAAGIDPSGPLAFVPYALTQSAAIVVYVTEVRHHLRDRNKDDRA